MRASKRRWHGRCKRCLPQEGLTAYQEVEDQLPALRILAGEAQSTADAVADSELAETIAARSYFKLFRLT